MPRTPSLVLLPLVSVLAAAAGGVGCGSHASAGKAPGPGPLDAVPASAAAPAAKAGPTVEADHGVVVCVSPAAAKVGCEVLRKGGNAVDAAVATAFALAVVWPEAGNIGGGGFMMVGRPPALLCMLDPEPVATEPPVVFIDYRETAPAAVKPDTFSNKPSQYLIAGTPGTVRGLHTAYERFGSKKVAWADLVAPAIELATKGVEVDTALARSLNAGLRGTGENNGAGAFAAGGGTAEFRRVYGKPGGTPWAAGDKLVLPDLAGTLKRVAEKGPAGFYEGKTAELVAAEVKRGGGLMTAADLAAYEAKIREPIVGSFRGLTVFAPPPPSSGGVALLQILGMMDPLGTPDRWAPATVHRLVEAMRRAYADRARYLGDPGFTDVPVAKLVDAAYVKQMGDAIDPAKATKSEAVAPWATVAGDAGGQTTHFSVADAGGMVVSNTYTLEQSFGGKIVVPGAGFLLNDELGDFNPKPGVTTRLGMIGTEPNQAIGGKRPLSSMTPTLVAKDGKFVLVTGSPGGRTIINTVTQVVLNRLMFGMGLRDAVDAPRLHHQWFPDTIRAEQSFGAQHSDVLKALADMGHAVDPKSPARMGDVHSIAIDPTTGRKTGVADTRIGGGAAGY